MSNEITIVAFFIILVSFIFKLLPPKRINSIYGYRTPRSMKNQDTWNEANKFSSNLMLAISLLFIMYIYIFGENLSKNISIIV